MSFRRYTQVPPGSTVEVEVSPCDGNSVVKAKLISAADVLTWNPCQSGPPAHTLEAHKNYFVSVRFAFTGTSSVRVKIQVRTPTGGVHSSPWGWQIDGENGEVALVGGFIQVA